MLAPNGGHARIGFENNLYRADGRLAASTSELVVELVKAPGENKKSIASNDDTRSLLAIA
ncbi:MAG: 3-keto-5-aminohexanoate cleavage protein [Gammaproteobacteria bacterium]|nr:3-keto-5-aminohexanoate cleavage protein [Gammaproteobacteria bacterium]